MFGPVGLDAAAQPVPRQGERILPHFIRRQTINAPTDQPFRPDKACCQPSPIARCYKYGAIETIKCICFLGCKCELVCLMDPAIRDSDASFVHEMRIRMQAMVTFYRLPR